MVQQHRCLRFTGVLALCIASCFCALMIIGCGPSDEQRITDIATQEFEAIKAHDGHVIDGLMPEEARTALSNVGIDSDRFLQSALAGFDYSIGDVSVDKDSATVTVSVTCKTVRSVSASLRDEARQDAEGNWGGAYLSDEEATQQVADDLMTALDAAQPVSHDDISLSFKKSDKTWSLAPESQATLASLFLS